MAPERICFEVPVRHGSASGRGLARSHASNSPRSGIAQVPQLSCKYSSFLKGGPDDTLSENDGIQRHAVDGRDRTWGDFRRRPADGRQGWLTCISLPSASSATAYHSRHRRAELASFAVNAAGKHARYRVKSIEPRTVRCSTKSRRWSVRAGSHERSCPVSWRSSATLPNEPGPQSSCCRRYSSYCPASSS